METLTISKDNWSGEKGVVKIDARYGAFEIENVGRFHIEPIIITDQDCANFMGWVFTLVDPDGDRIATIFWDKTVWIVKSLGGPDISRYAVNVYAACAKLIYVLY